MSEPTSVPPGQLVTLPGRGKTYVRDVAGPPGAPTVVLLHGLGATTALNWPGAFDALRTHFRVIGIDHRGHGRGIRTARRFRLADCADDVAALADEMALERVIAAGYSMGGPVALLARHRHPERIGGLVLCATSAVFGDAAVRSPVTDMLSTSLRLTPPLVRRRMMSSMMQMAGPEASASPLMQEARRHDMAAVMEAGQAVRRFDARPWLDSLGCPVASVITTADGMVPASRQLALASAAHATVHRIDADHGVAVRQPRVFLPVLLEACRSVAGRLDLPAAS